MNAEISKGEDGMPEDNNREAEDEINTTSAIFQLLIKTNPLYHLLTNFAKCRIATFRVYPNPRYLLLRMNARCAGR
jgi:hypothetical protein